MNKKVVLVLDGEIRKTLSVVRSIGSEYNVVVLSKYSFSISSASKFCYKAFTRNSESIIHQALAIGKEVGASLLIATQEDTLIKLSRNYDDFINEGIIPTFPKFEVLDRALNKSKTFHIALESGVKIPKTLFPKNKEELLELAPSLGFPIVIKPIRSISIDRENTFSNSGPSYAKSYDELVEVVKGLPDHMETPVLQEFIHGTGEGGFFLVDKSGEIKNHFAHKRIRDVNPKGSGSSFRCSAIIEPEILESSTTLLKAMEWEGVAMVEFRKSTKGEFYLMEVNGRFWGSLDLARQAGLDFPLNLVKMYEGLPVESGEYLKDIHVRWFLGDILRFFRILKGKPKGYPGSYPSRLDGIKELFDKRNFKAKLEVLKFNDPLPFLAEILSIVH
jgi:predicted ATP-grasp superfamily ATP-dependent carboligase